MSGELGQEIIHIAGLDVQVGPRLRQRCGWCGMVLEDVDLRNVAVVAPPEGGDPGPYPVWAVGSLVAHDGVAWWAVDHVDGDQLPEACCASIDPEVTV